MSDDSISVVIPVHDGERYLAAAVDSVLGQSTPPAELVVVDDGSEDRTPAILAAYGERVRSERQAHAGAAAAVNRGVVLCGGELIAFLDADDVWAPRKLALQHARLAADPRLDMVFGHVEQFRSDELTSAERAGLRRPAGTAPGISRGTMLIRRAALHRVGPFGESWAVGEFLDWYARAVDLGLRSATLPEVVMRRRLHGANSSARARAEHTDYVRILRDVRRRRESAQP